MSQEVVQWLNEIKVLKQDIADLQAELAESNATAEKWQRLYDTEASQRRQETAQFHKQVEDLQDQIQVLQAESSPSDLRVECDRLKHELAAEKTKHEQSRKDLTTALSDAMELLSKGKQRLPDVVE